VLYVLFDAAANGLVWLLNRLFGVRPEQLAWLIGEYRENESEISPTGEYANEEPRVVGATSGNGSHRPTQDGTPHSTVFPEDSHTERSDS